MPKHPNSSSLTSTWRWRRHARTVWSIAAMATVWITMRLASVVTMVVVVMLAVWVWLAMWAWLWWAWSPSILAMVTVTLAMWSALQGKVPATSTIVMWRTNIYNNKAIIATDTKRYARRTTSTIICRSTAHCHS